MQRGTNLPKVGSYNRAVVLEAIQFAGGTSRVEIAERTGLTAQTISGIVRKLLDEGLVREDGAAPSAWGKPRTILRIAPDAGYVVGILFDPVEIAYVVADLAGQSITTSRQPVLPGADPDEVITQMATTVRAILRKAKIPRERVLGIGVGCPGPIDPEKGLVIKPPQLPQWEQVPLKQLLQERTKLEVTVDNDATAAAIGERRAGLGRNAAHFAYLYLGTGVGGGLFLSHQIYRGSSANAAEFGHVTVSQEGPDCYCGNRGCLEALCSTSAIEATTRAQLSAGVPSSLAGKSTVDHAGIVAAALAGDQLANSVIDNVAGHLATAMVSAANILDIDLIVIGGHATHGVGERYRDAIARALQARSIARHVHNVDVQLSPLGDDAGPIGAASLVLHTAFSPSLSTLWTQSG